LLVFWLFRLVAAWRRSRGHRLLMCLCNIGNQQPVELLHVVHTIERCLGRSVQIRLMPTQ
jgi:hypothetical protein